MAGYSFRQSPAISFALQTLAREQMKERLLQDILTDITVSKFEGWDYKQYLLELKAVIDGFLTYQSKKER